MQIRSNALSRAGKQRGITLLGLLAWVIIIGFGVYITIRVLPTINEYMTIQRTVDKLAAAAPSSVPEIRAAFERQKDIEYAIQSISSKDLQISKQGDRVVIAFQYEKEVPLGGPVFLLLKYKGRSK